MQPNFAAINGPGTGSIIPPTTPAPITPTPPPASIPPPTTSVTPTSSSGAVPQPTTPAATPAPTIDQNYQMQPNETVDQYNARIASYNAAKPANAQSNTSSTPNQVQSSNTPSTTDNGSTIGPTDANGNPLLSDQADRQALAQAQADYQAQAAQVQTTISNIQNGTTPLTTGEQAQVSGLQQQFQTLIDAQNLQNKGAVGLANTRGYQNGAAEYDPTFQVKTIGAVASAGAAKVASLQVQEASAVAQLTQAFHDNDIKAIQDAWSVYQDASNARQTALQNTIKDTTDAIQSAYEQQEQAIKDANDQKTLELQEIMDNQTISYQDKQQALAQSTLDEKTQNDLQTQALNKFKANIDAATLALNQQKESFTESQASTGGIAGLPQVSMNASNNPDPAAQAAFLAQLPPLVATQVKGIANYSINPSSFSTSAKQSQGGLTQGQLVALAAQYDPSFDQSQYATRQALQKNFTSGTYSQQITALNTATGHLESLANDISDLGNINFTPYNYLKNQVGPIFGASSQAGAKLDLGAVTGELASAFKKSGATDSEIASLGTIGPNSTPNDLKSYISAATDLMGSKLDGLQSTYVAGMGKDPSTPFLSDSATQALLKLQQQGYNIKVPQLADTPQVKLQTFHDADPSNASLIDQIMTAQPNLQPQDVVDILEQNGVQI